jgi:hypothetical protein
MNFSFETNLTKMSAEAEAGEYLMMTEGAALLRVK